MGLIILPNDGKPTPEEMEAMKKRRSRYETDPALRKLADEIHDRRLMAPPACDGCICMAIRQLYKEDVP